MTVLNEVQKLLEEVLEAVNTLPQGYQYKVRELSSCIETVVSMHDDIQRGIIPEIFMKQEVQDEKEPEPEPEVKTEVVLKLPVSCNLDLL